MLLELSLGRDGMPGGHILCLHGKCHLIPPGAKYLGYTTSGRDSCHTCRRKGLLYLYLDISSRGNVSCFYSYASGTVLSTSPATGPCLTTFCSHHCSSCLRSWMPTFSAFSLDTFLTWRDLGEGDKHINACIFCTMLLQISHNRLVSFISI